jgi:hypothetical protein
MFFLLIGKKQKNTCHIDNFFLEFLNQCATRYKFQYGSIVDRPTLHTEISKYLWTIFHR